MAFDALESKIVTWVKKDLFYFCKSTIAANFNPLFFQKTNFFNCHFLFKWKIVKNKALSKFSEYQFKWYHNVIQSSGYNMDIGVINPLVIREEQRSYQTGEHSD